MTEKELMLEVAKAKFHLESLGYNVAYIGIYGSQNYGLAEYTEEYMSDIDFKAVIVPNLDDLVFNSKPKSTTLTYGDGQIDLKDIRVFTDTLIKCNPAYIETLFTPYAIYSDDYKYIINERDQIVNEMGVFLLKASYGMIMEKIKAFSHPYPSIVDKVEKFGYDPKQLHHIVRLFILMNNYKNGKGFVIRNGDEDIEYLMKIKKGSLSLKEAIEERDFWAKKALKIKENYEGPTKFNSKDRIINFSKSLIKKKIIDDVKGKKKKVEKPNYDGYCGICGKGCIMSEGWTECTKCKTKFKPLPNM